MRFRNLLSELSGERIVILSTHIVSDVEAVATDIAILNHGLLLAHHSPESLLAAISGKVWEIIVPSPALPALQQQHLISSTAHRTDGVHVRVVSDSPPMPQAQPLDPILEDAILLPSPAAGQLPREWPRQYSARGICFRASGFPRTRAPLQLSFHTGISALLRLSRYRWHSHAAPR